MRLSKKTKKFILVNLSFLFILSGLHAQSLFPYGDFWSLDAGIGMSGLMVKGTSYQLVVDPKLWLSPALMVGAKTGINFSAEQNTAANTLSNILTFEGQVYMRWNFLRLGNNLNRQINIFAQGGLGLIAAYRGDANPLDNVETTRGSIMFDAAAGVTIPLTDRWHLEPEIRGGYPHMFGFSITAGYKFPLPQKTVDNYITNYQNVIRTEYVGVMNSLPPEEIIKRVMITSVEYVLFGPDIGKYNIGVDKDAQALNELVINQTVQRLKDNPNLRVRIEGHANPYTINVSEADELQALSTMRAEVVAGILRDRGVSDEQIVMIAFGGTRTVTNEWDIRNRNRRVEMILIQVDLE
ncbi:MAG: OmpA family protein [Treponema sp.]|nr:OmpA family protein [Treponema sp.]